MNVTGVGRIAIWLGSQIVLLFSTGKDGTDDTSTWKESSQGWGTRGNRMLGSLPAPAIFSKGDAALLRFST